MAYTEVNTLIHNAITTVAPRKKSTKRKPTLLVFLFVDAVAYALFH
jgi:hypothetical protein